MIRQLQSFRRQSLSRRGGILQGCLIATGVVVVLVIIGIVVLAMNAKNIAASAASGVAKALVDTMPLPAQEKPELKDIIERVSVGVKSGDITLDEAGAILEGLATNPAIAMGGVILIESEYIVPSTLTDEEKESAALELNRVAQGIIDGTISWSEAGGVTAPIETAASTDQSPEWKEPSQVTEDELREVIANAKALADQKSVPNEKLEIDLSDEFERSIEETLGRELPPLQ